MKLCRGCFDKWSGDYEQSYMKKNEIRVRILGDYEHLPADIQESIKKVEEASAHFENLQLNICLCYNGTKEIYQAAQKLSNSGKKELTESDFDACLYGGTNCRPEVIIRTSNEVRFSGFLLHQSKNAQVNFVENFWPDFSLWDMCKILH